MVALRYTIFRWLFYETYAEQHSEKIYDKNNEKMLTNEIKTVIILNCQQKDAGVVQW